MRRVLFDRVAYVANRGVHERYGADKQCWHRLVPVGDRTYEGGICRRGPNIVFRQRDASGLQARTELDAKGSTGSPVKVDRVNFGTVDRDRRRCWGGFCTPAIDIQHHHQHDQEQDPLHLIRLRPSSLQPSPGIAEALGQDPCLGNAGDEIGIPGPAWHYVHMNVIGYSSA
jgi:hypothetical protein